MAFLKKLWTVTYVIGISAILLVLFIWVVSQFLKPYKIDDTWGKSYCQVSKIMATKTDLIVSMLTTGQKIVSGVLY
jgi:hypothetical protein